MKKICNWLKKLQNFQFFFTGAHITWGAYQKGFHLFNFEWLYRGALQQGQLYNKSYYFFSFYYQSSVIGIPDNYQEKKLMVCILFCHIQLWRKIVKRKPFLQMPGKVDLINIDSVNR